MLLYNHPEFKDVCFHLIDIKGETEDHFILDISWWNKGQSGIPWPMNIYETNKKFPKKVFNECYILTHDHWRSDV